MPATVTPIGPRPRGRNPFGLSARPSDRLNPDVLNIENVRGINISKCPPRRRSASPITSATGDSPCKRKLYSYWVTSRFVPVMRRKSSR